MGSGERSPLGIQFSVRKSMRRASTRDFPQTSLPYTYFRYTRQLLKTSALSTFAFALTGVAAQADDLWQPQVRAVIGADNRGANAAIEGFIPLKQTAESVLFLDVRGKHRFDDGFGQDVGIGVRRLVNPDLLVGGYAYANVQTIDGHTFSGATLGIEAITANYDGHLNVYVPFGGDGNESKGNSSLSLVGNQLLEQVSVLDRRSYSAWGIEGEFGVQVPFDLPDNHSLRLDVGGYHFADPDHRDGSITGAKAGIEYAIRDAFNAGWDITLAGEVRSDNRDHTQFAGSIQLSVPFNPPARNASQEEIATAYPVSEGLRKRVNERVRGDIGVRVNTQETTRGFTRNAINAATGAAFGTFFFADGENSLGLGTQGDPTTLDDAVARAGKDGFVVALGGKGNILTGGATLVQGQTVIGGAGTVKALSYFGGTTTYNFGGSNGTIAGTKPGKAVLSLANGNTISGITVTGGGIGISGNNINGAALNDVTVTGAGSHGVAFTGTSTGVTGTGLASSGNAGDGLHIESDGTFNFAGTTLLSGNAGDGLDIKGKGTYAFATLHALNNTGDGIHVAGTGSTGKFSSTGGTVSGNGGIAVFIDPITANVVLDQISQNGGAAGIILDQVSGSFTVTGKTKIAGTSGAGISISDAPAAIRFGDVEIGTPGGDGISFAGVNAAVVAGNIVISGLGLGATGLDFSGSQTVFTAQSANIAGGAIGIDLTGTLAGSKITIANGGSITGGGTGVRLGIAGSLAGTANADFRFGGGTIGGSLAALDARGLNPGAGTYAFSTTVFTGAQLFDIRNLMFVGATATGSGDGSSINNLATIAQADASTDSDATFVLVNRGAAIDAAGGFTLGTGQILASFGNGRSFSLGGVPLNVTGTNVQNGTAISDAGGAATLTSSAGSSTIAMANNTSLVDVNLTNAKPGGGIVVQATGASNIVLTGTAISGGSTGFQGTNVNGVALSNVSVSGAAQDGVAFDGTSTNISGANLTSTGNGNDGLLIASDGSFNFTGTTLLSGNTVYGLEIKGKGTYTFAALNAQNNPGGGIHVAGTSNTGRFSTTGGNISGNGGTAVSVDLITADVVLNQLNQNGGVSGIALSQVSGSFAITGNTSITGTSGAGIAISATAAAVHFGDVAIHQPAASGIKVKATNGIISFGNIDITALCNCGIGLDLSSSSSTFTARTLDVTGTPGAGSTGIDLSGTTGGSVTIGGGVISGVDTGVQLGSHGLAGTRANTTLNFGAAGGSSISGTVASLDTRGLLASSGSYEFNTTVFNGPQLFDSINLIFVGSAATGAGDGSSVHDLADINFADGIAAANAVFVLVNDGTTIDDATGFTLSTGQTLASFGNGRIFNTSGAPLNVTHGANIIRGGTQPDPTGFGAATLKSSGGGNTLILGDGNLVADLIINSSGVAIDGASGITGFNTSGVTINGAVTGLDLTGASGTITVEKLTLQGIVQNGIVLANSNATANFTGSTKIAGGSGAALLVNNFNGTATFADLDITGGTGRGVSIENGSTGALTFGAASSITSPLGIAFFVNNSASTATYSGTITQNNAASAVALTSNAGGTITFGAITANTAGAKAISIANNTGGTFNFTGQVNASTTTATAIMLDTNTGAAINFTGGLDIVTTGGDGFTAINNGPGLYGGTVTVTGAGNTIASGGNGLLMGGMVVGAGGITFDSISAKSNAAGAGVALSFANLLGDVNIGGLTDTGFIGGVFAGLSGPGKVNLTGTIDLDLTDPFSIGFDFGGTIGTVNIANVAGSTLTIDGAWLGVQFSGAQGGTANIGGNGGAATITAAQATGSAIALNSNTIGGPVLNYTGALNVSAGNVLSTGGADLAVLNLAGTVTSTTSATAFNFAVASGIYNILSSISHSGGTGVNVGPGALATGTITFSGASKTFNTGASTAVSMAGVGTLSFTNGGLGITTSSGTGLSAIAGTVNVSGATGNTINSTAGTAVSLSNVTANVTLNSATATGGPNGISLNNMAGSFSVAGATQVSGTTGAAINIKGSNGTISFADLDITLSVANSTGFDVSGATVNANITATDFDLTSSSSTGTTAVDLTGTTGTATIQLGDTNPSGASATIGGTGSGPATGFKFSATTNVAFIYGDGEATDKASTVKAADIFFAPGNAFPTNGSYNFLDVDGAAGGFIGDTSEATGPTVYYVSPAGTGTGTADNPGSIAGAEASAAKVIILVDTNQNGTSDLIDMLVQSSGNNTLNLANSQILIGLAAGQSIDTAPLGAIGGILGTPPFQFSGINSSTIIAAAGNVDTVLPTLTTSVGNTIQFGANGIGAIQNVRVDNTGAGYGILGSNVADIIIRGGTIGTPASDSFIKGGNAGGLLLSDGAANSKIALSNLTLSATGGGVATIDGSVGAGAMTVSELENLTLNHLGETGGLGLFDVTFDANPSTPAIDTVNGGTLIAGTQAAPLAAYGAWFDVYRGKITFSNTTAASITGLNAPLSAQLGAATPSSMALLVAPVAGAGSQIDFGTATLYADGTGPTPGWKAAFYSQIGSSNRAGFSGGVTIATTNAAGLLSELGGTLFLGTANNVITTSGGPALALSNVGTRVENGSGGSAHFGAIATNGGRNGIYINTIASSPAIVFDSTVDISNTTLNAIQLDSAGSVSFNGNVSIAAASVGGVKWTTASATDTLTFAGNLSIANSNGVGFFASGGVVNVANGGQITTTSNTALRLSGVSVGASGIKFTGVTATGAGSGIDIANVTTAASGTIDLSTVSLTGITSRGVDITGTLGAALNFGSLTIGLNNSSAVAFDLNGVTLGAAITANDFDVSNAAVTGTSIGVDLSGVTGHQIVRLGDSNPAGNSSSISGVNTGVMLNATSDALFTFGDGGNVADDGDEGSTISAAVAIDASNAPVAGTYNFKDVSFQSSPGNGFGIGRTFFVAATATGDGSGRDAANRATLATAELAAGVNDIFIVINDSGAITAFNSNGNNSFVLKNGQRILGFGTPTNTANIAIIAPSTILLASNTISIADPESGGGAGHGGAATLVTNAASNIITLGASGNFIDGFILDGAGGVARGIKDNGAGATNTTISHMTIQNFATTGIEITPSTNTTVSDVTFSGNSQDIFLNALGTTLRNITSTGSTGAAAIRLDNTTGTTTLDNIDISGAAGIGLLLNNVGGTINATDVDLGGSGGGLSVAGGSGTVTFDASSSINTTGGTALSLTNTTGNITYGGDITHVAATSGINIDNHETGTVTFNTGTINISGGGIGIRVANSGSGTVNFNNSSIQLSTQSAGGVVLANTGGTVNFATGAGAGLDITTTAGSGFSATGGGTITVSGTGNSIATGTGTALNLVGMTLGAGNVTFGGVSANGASTGIYVEAVTGGSLNIGGGTIQNTGTTAIDIFGGSSDINVSNATITNAAGRSISVRTRSGGAISFLNTAISDTGQGLLFSGNTAGTTGFSGTGTRTVNVAGANNALTVIGGAGHTVSFAGTTALSANGAGNAVDVSNGATLAFTGTAISANGSGAALQADGSGIVAISGTGTLSAGATATAVDLNTVATTGISFASTSKAAGGTSAVIMNSVTGTGTVALGSGTLNGGSGAVIRIGDGAGGASTGGTAGLTYSGTITSGTGQAINIQDRTAGAQAITLSGNISHAVAGQSGIVLADNAAGAITFSGGTKAINSANATAVSILNNAGATVSFLNGGLDIDTTTGTGFSAVGTTSITVGTGASQNTIQSTTGTALNLSGVAVGLGGITFNSVSSSGAANGMLISSVSHVAGSTGIDILGGSIVNATSSGVSIDSTSTDVAIATTISNTGGRTVSVTNSGRAGGSQITFSGAIDENGQGINLDNNDVGGNATIGFSGGLDISTGANTGFNAVNGGVVEVTGSANTIATTTGTALNVINTTIGASRLNFRSISSSGAASGIILNNTGTLGGLTVTGDGAAANNGSGGTIQNSTGDGISLTNTTDLHLARMNITNNLGDGIGGSAINGMVLDRLNISGNGNDAGTDESGINIVDLTGTVSGGAHRTAITNSVISNNYEFEIQITNHSGTLTNLQFTNNNVTADVSGGLIGNAFNFLGDGTSTMGLTVSGGSFTGNYNPASPPASSTGTGLHADTSGTAMTVNVSGATFTGNNAGINISTGPGSSTLTFDLDNNTFVNQRSNAINIFNNGNAPFTRTINGTITNNIIGNGADFSGSTVGRGIDVGNEGAVNLTVLISGNTIQDIGTPGPTSTGSAGIGSNIGIVGLPTGGGTTNLTITNNTISDIQDGRAILVDESNGTTGPQPTVFVNISGNTIGGFIGGQAGDGSKIRLDQDNGTFRVTQGAPGSGAASLEAVNTGVTGVQISVAGTVSYNQGTPPLPTTNPLPLLAAPGGVEAQGEDLWGDVLTGETLDTIIAAAIQRWAATGLTDEQLAALNATTFQIADLGSNYLGLASGNVIRIDDNGNGLGWYVDVTPLSDEEFANRVGDTLLFADGTAAPAGQYDLLTTVMHEFGHMLGLGDLHAVNDGSYLMGDALTTGERRLPSVIYTPQVSYYQEQVNQ